MSDTVKAAAFVSACMEERIDSTLEKISLLARPVPRSCHVGNNTSNNFGWLALAGHTRLALFDHTLYGVDINCFPWLIMGDKGLVATAFDHLGREVAGAEGRSVMAQARSIPRQYKSHLNFAIPAIFEGRPLFASHWEVLRALSREMNGSVPTCDSIDVAEAIGLLGEICRFAHGRGQLERLFGRWIKTNHSGAVVSLKVASIKKVQGDRLEVASTDGGKIFEGSLDEFLERLLAGAQFVAARTRGESPRGPLSYPWLRLAFNYVLPTVLDYRANPTQMDFWHAGGSSSQYYINEPEMAGEFNALRALLAEGGFLPARARLHIVPSFVCQLFATTDVSLLALDELLGFWTELLATSAVEARTALQSLAETQTPVVIVDRFARALPVERRQRLRRLLENFNAQDRCRLPIAHAPSGAPDSYHQFGLCQRHLRGVKPRFAEAFSKLTWGEAELLVKMLAWIVHHDIEPG